MTLNRFCTYMIISSQYLFAWMLSGSFHSNIQIYHIYCLLPHLERSPFWERKFGWFDLISFWKIHVGYFSPHVFLLVFKNWLFSNLFYYLFEYHCWSVWSANSYSFYSFKLTWSNIEQSNSACQGESIYCQELFLNTGLCHFKFMENNVFCGHSFNRKLLSTSDPS